MIRLLALFTVVPALELFLLLQLGARIGPWPTFLILIGTGLLGSSLLRWQGLGVLAKLVQEARQGIPPGRSLAEGALVVLGGVLLITPGVITDVTGLLLLVPPVRRALAPRLLAWLAARATVQGGFVTFGAPQGGSGAANPFSHPGEPVAPPSPLGAPKPARKPFDHPVAR